MPQVTVLVGAEVDRSASALLRSVTGGDDDMFMEKGREMVAIAFDKVEFDAPF